MKLVINASPVIFLAKIKLINFLPEIVDKVVIPQAVIHEIEKHIDDASKWIKRNRINYSVNAENVAKEIQSWDLGKGETEVITYALKNKDFTVGLDDKAARNCAQSFQIKTIGTIGLIILAKRKKIIENAEPYLYNLKETGYRIDERLFEKALKLANQ
jgi:predicted nucleic acid-binding protein